MITVIKKIIVKEKEGKRQGKKRILDETRTWKVCSNVTVLPLGNEGSLASIQEKALVYIKLTSSSP